MKTHIIDWTDLSDHFLVALPSMVDEAFVQTLIYVCEHNERGTLGLVINRTSDLTVNSLLERLQLPSYRGMINTSPVLAGGPVQAERGFVLHETNAIYQSTLQIRDGLSLTTSRDILEAVAAGDGPERWLIALGYAGWGAGQLEREIRDNAWLTVPATAQILFDTPIEHKFDAAFYELGINPYLLTQTVGHA
jgi:putative transcriptional regulator